MSLTFLLTCLSLTSSTLSTVQKVPQILAIWRTRSVSGINRNTLLIEMWNFMMTISYSVHFAYPPRIYAEFGALICQSLVILSFVLLWTEKQPPFPSNRHMILILSAAGMLHACIALRLLPSFVPIALITTGLPSGIIGRLMQIRQIIRTGDSGSLSASTWAIASITTFCRFGTNFLTVRDPILLIRVGSAMTLNIVLASTILVYRQTKKKEA